MWRSLLVAAAGLLLASGCPTTEPCAPNSTRCAATANAAEFCSADGEWLTLMDCDDLGTPGWACCRTADGCTCMPVGAEECNR
jgi:hypothetical protein